MEVVRGDNPGGSVDRSSYLEQVVSPPKIDWVNPKVTRITSTFTTETSVVEFLDKFSVLKADASRNFFRVEPCSTVKTICLGRSPTESPFLLHVFMSFFRLARFLAV